MPEEIWQPFLTFLKRNNMTQAEDLRLAFRRFFSVTEPQSVNLLNCLAGTTVQSLNIESRPDYKFPVSFVRQINFVSGIARLVG